MIGLTAGLSMLVGAFGTGFMSVMPVLLIAFLGPAMTFSFFHRVWEWLSRVVNTDDVRNTEVYDLNNRYDFGRLVNSKYTRGKDAFSIANDWKKQDELMHDPYSRMQEYKFTHDRFGDYRFYSNPQYDWEIDPDDEKYEGDYEYGWDSYDKEYFDPQQRFNPDLNVYKQRSHVNK